MENAQEIVIERAQLSDEIAALFHKKIKNIVIEDLKNDIQGGAVLFAVRQGSIEKAYYVLRVDRFIKHNEGVIVAAVATNENDLSLIREILPQIEKQFQGCEVVRLHTQRRGLARILLKKMGYQVQEIVLTKEIKGGCRG